jgi:1-acyl-sn-glycerol-3-phosphate acyltransferase
VLFFFLLPALSLLNLCVFYYIAKLERSLHNSTTSHPTPLPAGRTQRLRMAHSLKTITEQIDDIEKRILVAKVDQPSCTNVTRRILYSDTELTRLQILEISSLSPEDVKSLHARLDSMASQLDLHPLSKGNSIGKFFRMTSLTLSLIISGAFLALPMILLRPLDTLLHTNSSEFLKRMISHWLLLVSGVMVTIEGQQDCTFQEACMLLTFSHASNLDGFMISCSCPVRHYALAKKELFLVPFFSWISLAFGGVPVDRNDRARAISALQRSTQAAASATSAGSGGGGGGERMCLVIAPEGTRSKSGQLNAFKKGAFHMWEQMQAPIAPVHVVTVCVLARDMYIML